jgi:CheY-like chemotaxis protein
MLNSGMIKTFEKKNFLEQIKMLNQIIQDSDLEYVDELMEIYASPLGDDSVDAFVEHTLRDLLKRSEKKTVEGLNSPVPRIKRLCLQIVGCRRFKSAVPVMADMARNALGDKKYRTIEPEIINELMLAMSKIKCLEFLEIFRKNINHEDEWIAGLCIDMLGEYSTFFNERKFSNKKLGHEGIFDAILLEETLFQIIESAEKENRYQHCTLRTAKALETLARIGTDRALQFLVSNLHHKKTSARRIMYEELVKLGDRIVPFMEKLFETSEPVYKDKKFMSINVLGEIASRKSGRILVKALENGNADHPNVKFALYQALGGIKMMKSLICLMDALEEENSMLLISAVAALDKLLSPLKAGKIKQCVLENFHGHGAAILQAVVQAEAMNLFGCLYVHPKLAIPLVTMIKKTNSRGIISSFVKKIKSIDAPHANRHLEYLTRDERKPSGISNNLETGKKRILAVDDSRTMLALYRTILSSAGYSVYMALNGQEALKMLEAEIPVDMVITDMNMPVMDGITFARSVRTRNSKWKNLPILMVSTESDQSQLNMARNAGVNAFITKPTSPENFIDTVSGNLTH